MLGENCWWGDSQLQGFEFGWEYTVWEVTHPPGGWDLGEMARKGKLGGEGLDWGVCRKDYLLFPALMSYLFFYKLDTDCFVSA